MKNKGMTVGEAYDILQKLLDADMILAATSSVDSINQSETYKFTADEMPSTVSAKSVMDKTDDIGYSGIVLYKGGVFWSDRFMVLNRTEKKFYIFSSDKASRPTAVVDLTLAKIVVAECACKTGWYCWTVVDEATKKNTLAV